MSNEKCQTLRMAQPISHFTFRAKPVITHFSLLISHLRAIALTTNHR